MVQRSVNSGDASSRSITSLRLSGEGLLQERVDLIWRGRKPDEVEKNAAQELLIGGEARGSHIQSGQFAEDVIVDEVAAGDRRRIGGCDARRRFELGCALIERLAKAAL